MNKLANFIRGLFVRAEEDLEDVIAHFTATYDRLLAFEQNADLKKANIDQQITDLAREGADVAAARRRAARIRSKVSDLIDLD